MNIEFFTNGTNWKIELGRVNLFSCVENEPLEVILEIAQPEALTSLHPTDGLHASKHGPKVRELLAAAGTFRWVIATHSEHVLHAVRIMVNEGEFSRHDVRIYHVILTDGEVTQIQLSCIDSDGNLDAWPTGFFDQSEIDMSRLLGYDKLPDL